MDPDDSFNELMARVRSGDPTAETLVFRRFVQRLIVLASRQFEAEIREKVDVEGVVQSACKSFFLRQRRAEFDLDDWEELWSLLATITLRKCAHRRDYLRAARRDAMREEKWPANEHQDLLVPDRAPTPEEAAILVDTMEQFLGGMELADRPIVEQILLGYTAAEVAHQLDCSERTVRRVRQRAKRRLERLIAPGPAGA
jgi:RNA polymerase sigma-70 factor (ECF subfamily)